MPFADVIRREACWDLAGGAVLAVLGLAAALVDGAPDGGWLAALAAAVFAAGLRVAMRNPREVERAIRRAAPAREAPGRPRRGHFALRTAGGVVAPSVLISGPELLGRAALLPLGLAVAATATWWLVAVAPAAARHPHAYRERSAFGEHVVRWAPEAT